MEPNAKEIGNRIKKYRKNIHMTQKELAKKIGCAEMTISQYERGLYSPKIDARIAIAKALGVEYVDLFGSDQERADPDFSPYSSGVLAYKGTDILKSLLRKMMKVSLLEDKRFIRVYGNGKDDYIDMNAAEYSGFLLYLVRLIESGCQNYIDVCRNHDETKDLIPKE